MKNEVSQSRFQLSLQTAHKHVSAKFQLDRTFLHHVTILCYDLQNAVLSNFTQITQ